MAPSSVGEFSGGDNGFWDGEESESGTGTEGGESGSVVSEAVMVGEGWGMVEIRGCSLIRWP